MRIPATTKKRRRASTAKRAALLDDLQGNAAARRGDIELLINPSRLGAARRSVASAASQAGPCHCSIGDFFQLFHGRAARDED